MSITNQQKITIGAAVIFATAILIAALLLYSTVEVHSHGNVNEIGFILWANANRTIDFSSVGIDWGTLNPGDIHGVVGWAQNTQTVNFTLSFITWNWVPTTAQQYLVFGWNYTGQIMHPGDLLPIQLTCTALRNITGISSFSFDINMTATQV